jgi:phosphoglycolate phosphatase
VVVGDSANDVAAAHAAGLPVIVVATGYTRVPPETLGAELVIDGLAQLPAAFADIRPRVS